MALGGDAQQGAVQFTKLTLPRSGVYTLRLLYVRNGLEDKEIGLRVNGQEQQVKAIMRSWNWVEVPVSLQAGDNAIEVSYAGKLPFYLDWLSLRPASPANTKGAR